MFLFAILIAMGAVAYQVLPLHFSGHKEAYVHSRDWVSRDILHSAKVVYAHPNPKCDLPYDNIAQTIGNALDLPTTRAEPLLQRDYFALYVTFACGLTRSTFYRKGSVLYRCRRPGSPSIAAVADDLISMT
jgi:hypothetical protein